MRQIPKSKFRMYLFLTGVFILLMGCSSKELQTIVTPSSSTPQPTIFASSGSKNGSATIKAILTSTPTETITPQPKNLPTWTPIPTLKPDEALEIVLDLYADNGGCELPCWWGIFPGQTSWVAAREKLSPLGFVFRRLINENLEIYEFEFVVPVEVDPLGLGFIDSTLWVRDGYVTAISSNTGWIMRDFDYSLSELLKTFGQPEEIWIKVDTDTMDLPIYELDLFYPSKGIQLNSAGDASAENKRSVTICPKEFRRGEFPPAILIWDASIEYAFKDLSTELLGGSRDIGGEGFELLEDVAVDFDEEQFFNTYQNASTNRCIEIDVTKLEK